MLLFALQLTGGNLYQLSLATALGAWLRGQHDDGTNQYLAFRARGVWHALYSSIAQSPPAPSS